MATYHNNDTTKLSDKDLIKILTEAGFTDPDSLRTAYAVVYRESNARPAAYLKNTNGTLDRGIFQINDVNLKSLGISNPASLYNAKYNAEKAYKLSKGGQIWWPWAIPNADGSVTNYAAYLRKNAPDTYRLYNEKFQQYLKQFDSLMKDSKFREEVQVQTKAGNGNIFAPLYMGIGLVGLLMLVRLKK